MKTIKPLLFLLMGLLLMQASCEPQPSVPKPIAEIDKLPPATQTGANTFGCLVNGKAWVTRTSLDAYAESQLNDFLVIYGYLLKSSSEEQIAFVLEGTHLDIGSYYLNDSDTLTDSYIILNNNACHYRTLDSSQNILTITKFDRANSIVSGYFKLDVVGECGEVDVTDGRFDLTLLQ